MKKSLGVALTGLWLLSGTFLLSRWWYSHPDTFPRLPAALWTWLDKFYGASNVDGASDVEALVVLALAFTIVATIAWMVWFLRRRVQTAK